VLSGRTSTYNNPALISSSPQDNRLQLPAERGGRIPAAALTAYAAVEDRMRLLSAGYQMHIPKPIEPAELATVVANLAQRYSSPLPV